MSKIPYQPTQELLVYVKDNFMLCNGNVYRTKDQYKGSINGDGYIQFKLYNWSGQKIVTLLAHHIAWFLYYGEWPTNQLDHKDRNKKNNDKNNLEISSSLKQSYNRDVRPRKDGLPSCVRFKDNRYEVYLNIAGKKHYFGRFDTVDEAVQRRDEIRDEILKDIYGGQG